MKYSTPSMQQPRQKMNIAIGIVIAIVIATLMVTMTIATSQLTKFLKIWKVANEATAAFCTFSNADLVKIRISNMENSNNNSSFN